MVSCYRHKQHKMLRNTFREHTARAVQIDTRVMGPWGSYRFRENDYGMDENNENSGQHSLSST